MVYGLKANENNRVLPNTISGELEKKEEYSIGWE
jgi:hypothetical protein